MLAIAKALLIIAKSFRRIATALESIQRLYRLDLQSRGIVEIDPTLADEVEVIYGRAPIDPDFL